MKIKLYGFTWNKCIFGRTCLKRNIFSWSQPPGRSASMVMLWHYMHPHNTIGGYTVSISNWKNKTQQMLTSLSPHLEHYEIFWVGLHIKFDENLSQHIFRMVTIRKLQRQNMHTNTLQNFWSKAFDNTTSLHFCFEILNIVSLIIV